MSNISSLAHQLAEKHLLDEKAAESFIKTFFSVVLDGINKDKTVKVRGLGTFKVTSVAPRESVDVGSGRRITIEGRDKITFTPDTAMRDLDNHPFAQFETVTVGDNVDFSSIDSKFAADSTAAMKELLGSNVVMDHSVPAETVQDETVEDTADSTTQRLDSTALAEEQTKDLAGLDTEEENVKAEEQLEHNNEEILQLSDLELEELNNGNAPAHQPQVEPAPCTKEDEQNDTISEEYQRYNPQPEESLSNEGETQENLSPQSDESSQKQPKMSNDKTPTENQSEPLTPLQEQWQQILENQMNKQLEQELEKSNKKVKALTIMVSIISVLFVISAVSCFFFWKGDSLFKPKVLADETVTVSPGVSKSATKSPLELKNRTKGKQKKSTDKSYVSKPQATGNQTSTTSAQQVDNNQRASFTDYVDNVRVRTGAYRIVGIQKSVTVKSGQTLTSLSKKYLGPGMECYLEAVNGGRKEFKAGENIRIPAIKLKGKGK